MNDRGLLDGFPVLEADAGELISSSRDPGLAFIVEGLARSFAVSTEQKPYYRIHGERQRRWAGDLFLYGELEGGELLVNAITPCRYRPVPVRWIREEAPRDLLLGLVDEFVTDIVRTISVEMVSRDGIRQRLLGTLLSLRQSTRYPEIELTHEDLAGITGISRARVSNLLKDFEKDGLIDTGYRMIRLGDEKTLLDALLSHYG